MHLGWTGLVLLSLADDLHRYWMRGSGRRIVCLGVDAAGAWHAQTDDGRRHAVTVARLLAWPWLCVVRFRTGRVRGLTAVIPADTMPPESHRRLRRALLEALRGEPGGAEPGAYR